MQQHVHQTENREREKVSNDNDYSSKGTRAVKQSVRHITTTTTTSGIQASEREIAAARRATTTETTTYTTSAPR